jgi:hypothetical protein
VTQTTIPKERGLAAAEHCGVLTGAVMDMAVHAVQAADPAAAHLTMSGIIVEAVEYVTEHC